MKVSDYHRTLSEVAEEIGVGRERVRQIEKQALEKVRIGLAAKGITPRGSAWCSNICFSCPRTLNPHPPWSRIAWTWVKTKKAI